MGKASLAWINLLKLTIKNEFFVNLFCARVWHRSDEVAVRLGQYLDWFSSFSVFKLGSLNHVLHGMFILSKLVSLQLIQTTLCENL